MNKKNTDLDELELYDGQRASLPDKTVTTDYIPNLRISARGKEIFALSENLYGKWLESQEDFSLIDRAVELCREAVKLGYPHAVVKMGFYYDKDYVDSERTEEYRCRVATDYYSKVVYADRPPYIDSGVTSELTWEDLRKTAAKMLLEMLAGSSAALSRDVQDSYGYLKNKQDISNIFPEIQVEETAVTYNRSKDMEKALQEVLKACKNNKFRAPLFGVLRLSAEEVLRVFSRNGFGWQASKNINVWLIGRSFLAKASATEIFHKNLNDELKAENSGNVAIWVCFFNSNLGGHRFVNEKNRNIICNYFMEDNYRVFKELINAAALQNRSMLIFSDDDVHFYRSHTPLEGAKTLIKKVTQRN
ncbi:MAG: hypothetical protein ACI4MQ_01335 [Candidatus Coproplasma sp.]